MASRRSRIEIIFDMLSSVRDKGNKIKPTHLLYKSNLSHKKMKEYVEDLLKNNMIQERVIKDKKFFEITEKGLKFIAEYKKIKEFSDSFGL